MVTPKPGPRPRQINPSVSRRTQARIAGRNIGGTVTHVKLSPARQAVYDLRLRQIQAYFTRTHPKAKYNATLVREFTNKFIIVNKRIPSLEELKGLFSRR